MTVHKQGKERVVGTGKDYIEGDDHCEALIDSMKLLLPMAAAGVNICETILQPKIFY